MKYQNIIRAVSEMPWAIRPSMLAVIIDIITYRSEGHRLTQAEIEDRIGAGPTRRQAGSSGGGGVAIIPVYGVLAPKASIFAQTSSSGTGVDQIRASLRQAMADPEVGAIMLDIDSPGGQVDQIPELAAEIRDARARKPIVAMANTDAASAAYWLAAQATEVVVTPSGQVGSVGVFSVHEDISAHLEQEGVRPTLISEGKYKVEGNPFEPLGDEAKVEIQAKVKEYYDMFVGDLAKGRGTSATDVRKSYGEGRMLTAKKALAAGMVDRIETFDQTLRRTMRMAQGPAQAEAYTTGIAGADISDTTDGPGNGPYADHGRRVLGDVEVFVRRTRERKEARTRERRPNGSSRALSPADRERLTEMREQLRAALPDLDDILAEEHSAAGDAIAAYAQFVELEARLNGVI